MKTLFTTLGIKEHSIEGILELFILDMKRYHISPPLNMRLKNGNRQIVLAAYAEHIYLRLALCNYFIIQSEAFLSQSAFTCLKLIIETLKQGVNNVQS